MNIKGMQKRLRDFAEARDWQSFHSPKNLAMALMVESAELLELFQWLTTEQSNTLTKDPEDRGRVSDEIADVMLYLLQIADRTGIDLEEAVEQKLLKNAQKYPAKRAEVQPSGPKVHLLVDWENVQPDADSLKQLQPEGTDVWLFHSPAQRMDAEMHKKAFGSNSVTLVERAGVGKNALDFQLSYYAGYLMARQPDARFVVVSNDKGYEPMLEHARKLEFQAQRQEYKKPAKKQVLSAPKIATEPKKAPVAGVKKTTLKSAQAVQLLLPQPVAEPTSARIAFRVKERLLALTASQRPADWVALVDFAQSLITEPVADKNDLAQKACYVLQLYGTVMRDVEGGNLRYRVPEPVVANAAAAEIGSELAAPLIGESASVDELAKGPTKLNATGKAKAQDKKPAKLASKPVAKTVASRPKNGLSQMAKKVEASLKKMSPNLPVHREGLMKLIATHLGPVIAKEMTPTQVCIVLQARQVVKISSAGVVLYFGAAKTVKLKESKA